MIIITNHAKKRIKERCGIRKTSVRRFAENAKARGFERCMAKGRLRNWLDCVHAKAVYRNGEGEIWVYGEKAFIFCGNYLITVLNLPTGLHRYAKNFCSAGA